MPRPVIQIVRRFGLVGGMESYVWHLSHELIQLGYQVTIICEQSESDHDPSIRVIVLPVSAQRRRWKAMRDFNNRLDQLFENCPELLTSIIHSHERTAWHQVTTFHGPPIKKTDGIPWYKKFSQRLHYWLDVEYRELCSVRVQRIIPVSKMIGDQLCALYPESQSRMMRPGYPALRDSSPKRFRQCGGNWKLLFVGKEWKRKGLPKAVEICDILAEKNAIQLDVFGVSESDVTQDLRRDFVNFHGYHSSIPFDQHDLIIHPAISEPFGMAVIEALANGCRALVSNRVGASEINHKGLIVKSIDASSSEWVDSALNLLREVPVQLTKFETWADLAMYHHGSIYKDISVLD